MLFDIFNYDITTAVISYIAACSLLMLFFNKHITSIADPLFYHILWVSSQIAFFAIYLQAYGPNTAYLSFVITLAAYISTLWFFCAIYKKNSANKRDITVLHLKSLTTYINDRWSVLAITLLALYLYSNKSFLEYALTCTTPQELFLFRFLDLQGRDPIERILKVSTYFLYFFLFTSIHTGKNRATSGSIIAIMLILAIASGGRSAIISFIISLGAFLFLHRFGLGKKTKNILNIAIGALYISAIFLAATVSSFYSDGDSLSNGMLIVFNRIFAAPDGVEYYLKFNGTEKIDSGIIPFLNSIFGIYLQNIFGMPYKNIGWQLTELAVGDVNFAQGSNYTVLLQAIVLNQYIAPIYGAIAGLLVARIRYINPRKPHQFFLGYTTSLLCFNLAIDIEYFILLMISAITVYLFTIIPIFKLKAS